MTTATFPKRRWPAAMAMLLLAATGLPGPARAATNNCNGCFAIVGDDGTLLRYRNVLYVNRFAVGQYVVVFKYPVTKCAYTATNAITLKYGARPTILEVSQASGNNRVTVG